MKKIIATLFLLWLTLIVNAQKTKTVFIEIRGNVDILGNISLDRIETTKKERLTLDSMINTKELQNEIIQKRDAVSVINLMSEKGWKFCNSMQILKDDSGKPNSSFIIYYFSKEISSNSP